MPEGIEFVEIDADNGLLSTLTCPHRELIAVTEKLAPNLECYRHGNLPDSIGNDAVQEGPAITGEAILAQHSRSAKRHSLPDSTFSESLTRVDIDARGRRTLMNAMR
ncbi:MAG TPA: hypothetical protein VF961_03315 [Pyrinomonadaceae bacterium]